MPSIISISLISSFLCAIDKPEFSAEISFRFGPKECAFRRFVRLLPFVSLHGRNISSFKMGMESYDLRSVKYN